MACVFGKASKKTSRIKYAKPENWRDGRGYFLPRTLRTTDLENNRKCASTQADTLAGNTKIVKHSYRQMDKLPYSCMEAVHGTLLRVGSLLFAVAGRPASTAVFVKTGNCKKYLHLVWVLVLGAAV